MHIGAIVICPHGGQVLPVTTNTRVLVSGQPVVTFSDTFTILGCVFPLPAPPTPCIKVQWIVPASRVTVNGQPVILQNSVGLCMNPAQVPQGPPNVVQTQMKVTGV